MLQEALAISNHWWHVGHLSSDHNMLSGRCESVMGDPKGFPIWKGQTAGDWRDRRASTMAPSETEVCVRRAAWGLVGEATAPLCGCGPHQVCVIVCLSAPQSPHISPSMVNRSSAISQHGSFSVRIERSSLPSSMRALCKAGVTSMFGPCWLSICFRIRRTPVATLGASAVPSAHPRKAMARQKLRACCHCALGCSVARSHPGHQFMDEGLSVLHATRTAGQNMARCSAPASPCWHKGHVL